MSNTVWSRSAVSSIIKTPRPNETTMEAHIQIAINGAVVEAVAAERERCARIADAETTEGDPYCCIPLAAEIAEKIRSGV